MTSSLLDPAKLAHSFSNQWKAYGNTSSSKLIKQWTTIFKTFNNSSSRNINQSAIEYSIIPAVTGSGKTQCLQWYAAELSKHPKNTTGVLIVAKLNEEARDIADQIIKWSGNNEKAATAYNSDSEFKGFGNESHLNEYQTVIISHEYYIRHHHLKSYKSGTYQQVITYKGNDRSLIVIDESIELVKHMSITKQSLIDIGSALYPYRGELTNESELIKYLEDNFDNLFGNIYHNEIISDNSNLINGVSNHLNIQPEEVIRLFSMRRAANKLKGNWKVAERLNELKQLLNNNLYKYRSGNITSYNSSSLELPNKSLVVLDATARVSKTYELLPNTKLIELPIVKDYSNVIIEMKYSDSRSELGKSGMVDNNDADLSTLHLNNIAREVAINELAGDKFAVFTFKGLIKNSGESYLYHYGSLDGTNDYKDCVHIVIYGIHYRPNFIYSNNLYQFSNKDPGTLKQSTSEFKYRHIAADIIQMINRGRCRMIKDGKALDMKVTLMMGNTKLLNDTIESAIRSEMVGVVINKSDSDHMMSFKESTKGYTGNINKSDQNFIDCIDTSQDNIKVSGIHQCAGSSTKEKKGINARIKEEGSWIAQELLDLKYVMEKRGNYNYLTRVL